MIRKIHSNAGSGYDIIIGKGLLSQLGEMSSVVVSGANKLAIFIDSTVNTLYGEQVESQLKVAGFETCRFVYPAGEKSKNMNTICQFTDFMSEHHMTRKDAVVAVGGGVAGDMGGFAASIYMRGIKFIQVPTTLLAAVDSSVGGKTGVDTAMGKNLLGAFWQPSLVLYDTDTFQTLTEDLVMDGTAEIIKTAAIRDEQLFEQLEYRVLHQDHGGDTSLKNIFSDDEALAEIVETCVKIKSDVVDHDEKESGLRKILNFGHTMGHAIEKFANFELSHGRAVAIGMLFAAKAAERMQLEKHDIYMRLYRLIETAGYATTTDAPVQELCKIAASDKKVGGDSISLIYLEKIGEAAICDIKLNQLYDLMK